MNTLGFHRYSSAPFYPLFAMICLDQLLVSDLTLVVTLIQNLDLVCPHDKNSMSFDTLECSLIKTTINKKWDYMLLYMGGIRFLRSSLLVDHRFRFRDESAVSLSSAPVKRFRLSPCCAGSSAESCSNSLSQSVINDFTGHLSLQHDKLCTNTEYQPNTQYVCPITPDF